jgi:hypothetical protein
MFDGYYSYNLNQPLSVTPIATPYLITPNTNIRGYDFYHNNIALNVAEISVKKKGTEISFTADLDFGPQADFNAASLVLNASAGPSIGSVDPVSKVLGQAFLTYTPLWAPNLTVDFGKMSTHLGYESWKSKDNWQYSRSTLFIFGKPLWHTGLHVGYSLMPKTFMLSAYVYNSWNSIYENNSSKTLGAQLKWTPSEAFAFAYNYIGGPEQAANDLNLRVVRPI